MAGKLSKVLLVSAAAAAGAGLYLAGRKSGAEEAFENADAQRITAAMRSGVSSRASEQPTKASMKAERGSAAPKSSAELREHLNERASDLLTRIIKQIMADGPIDVRFDRIVRSSWPLPAGKTADETAIPLEQTKQGTGELEPYDKIQKALSSSEFFEEKEEDSGKPREFMMP